MYVRPNFKTKKELKEALKEGKKVAVFSPGPFPPNNNGTEFIEGPHYPEPHRWYAGVTLKDGVITEIRS